jgi:hypothetical protein
MVSARKDTWVITDHIGRQFYFERSVSKHYLTLFSQNDVTNPAPSDLFIDGLIQKLRCHVPLGPHLK